MVDRAAVVVRAGYVEAERVAQRALVELTEVSATDQAVRPEPATGPR